MSRKLPCDIEATGVAETIGNWGFSNNKITSDGYYLERLKCLFAKIDSLRSSKKPPMCVKYDMRNDPEAWLVKSPDCCKPSWTFPMKRPFIVYDSTSNNIKISSLKKVRGELSFPHPQRIFVLQGTDKWYRRGPECCPQPSCLAPQCYSCSYC